MSFQDDAASLPFHYPPLFMDLPISPTAKCPSTTNENSKFTPFYSGAAGDFAKEGARIRQSWDWQGLDSAKDRGAKDHVHQPSSWVSKKCSQRSSWVGPTLMDIESALTLMSPVALSNGGICNMFRPCLSISSCEEGAVHEGTTSLRMWLPAAKAPDLSKLQGGTTQPLPRKSHETIELDRVDREKKLAILGTRTHKKTVPETRYTLKIKSELDTVEDGYRWRKYGQKFVKSNTHPRSYYRCTNARCQVKKQVERSNVEEGILEVSYEGIHLHHRPNPISNSLRAQLVEQAIEGEAGHTSPKFHHHQQMLSSPQNINQGLNGRLIVDQCMVDHIFDIDANNTHLDSVAQGFAWTKKLHP